MGVGHRIQTAMNKDEMRVKCAEACGWTEIQFSTDLGYIGRQPNIVGNENYFVPLPNYPASLDACTEFERTLTRDECHAYQDALIDIVRRDMPLCCECEAGKPWALRWTWHATPAQRCEAFLSVKGIL